MANDKDTISLSRKDFSALVQLAEKGIRTFERDAKEMDRLGQDLAAYRIREEKKIDALVLVRRLKEFL